MARFEVKIAGRKGIQSLMITAGDSKEASRIGSKQGRVTSVSRKFGIDLTPGMSVSDRYTWMIRMSTLMASKVGTAEGLRLMRDTFGGSIKKVSGTMLDRIEAGTDLPTAMEQDRKNFPGTTTALVKAGAASGETWRALRDAAMFEYKMANAHKGSMKQVYSACGAFLMAAMMMLGTTMYFGPMVLDNPMFATAEGVDVAWAKGVGNWCSGIMIVLLSIFGFFAWFGTIGRQMMPDLADKVILKIPYYKDLILSRNNHVTLYRLSLLIGSGVRIEEALALTEGSSPRGALKADLQRALQAVRNGRPWAKAMDTLHDTDKAALSTSTSREDISSTLDILATQYSDLYVQRITSFAPAVSAVAAIFMTLAGGVLFVQTILPMLQLSASY